MSGELTVRPPVVPVQADRVEVINPDTGEMLDLATAATEDLARARAAILAWETNARIAKQLLDGEIVRRMDAANEHTMYLDGGMKVTAPAAEERVVYDVEGLREALCALAADPAVNLEQAAVDEAVKPVVTYKPVAAKLNGLRKRGGVILEAIEANAHTEPVARRVTVKGPA